MNKVLAILIGAGLVVAGYFFVKPMFDSSRQTVVPTGEQSIEEGTTIDTGTGTMESESYSMTGGTGETADDSSNEELEKDLNSIRIEANFDALVE